MSITTRQIREFLLSKKGLTKDEKKEIENANEKDLKEMFEEFKKYNSKNKTQNDRFNDVWF